MTRGVTAFGVETTFLVDFGVATVTGFSGLAKATVVAAATGFLLFVQNTAFDEFDRKDKINEK